MRYLLCICLSVLTISLSAQNPFLIPFKENGKWGIMDSNERIVIKPIYNYIRREDNGDIWMRIDKGFVERSNGDNVRFAEESDFFVIDSTGKQILDSPYQSRPLFENNHAIVKKGLDWVIVSRKGVEINPNIVVEGLGYFKEGLLKIFRGGKCGFIDTNGIEIIPVIYDSALHHFLGGLVGVGRNGKWAVFNNKGKRITDFKYDDLDNCIESRLGFFDKKRGCGFLDTNGVEVVPPQYDYVSSFSDGIAYVKLDGKIGFIDFWGKIIVPPKYLYVGDFQEGRASVGDDEHQGIIDKNGKEYRK